MSDRCPPVTPRLHELARLAVRRLERGHQPLEVIIEALVAAIAPASGLPPAFDHLTPQMREVACVLLGAGEVRISAVAKALNKNRAAVQSLLARMRAYQLVTQSTRGYYALNLAAPTPRGMRFGLHSRRILNHLEANGASSVDAVAAALAKCKATIARKLRALRIAGILTCPKLGVYDIAERRECAA